jgi:hypothetical protein
VRLLQGTQQLVLLLGAAQESRAFDQRFRPTEELRARYQLWVGQTRVGSFVVPIEVVNQDQKRLLPWEDPSPKVGLLIEAANRNDWSGFDGLLTDSAYRQRVMRVLREMAPRAGEGWSATWRANGTSSRIDVQLGRRIKTKLDLQAYTSQPLTVTGRLITAKFAQHGAEISLPKLNRTLTFTYPAESEDELIEQRRGWVQITGSFKVDEDNNPLEAIEVTSADPLDLSPMHFDFIQCEGLTLRANTPLILTPSLDDEINQYLEVSDPEIDLVAFGRNRDELADAVAREIVAAWHLYALESPDRLTLSAQQLATQLKSKFTEEPDAAQTTTSGASSSE